MILSNKFICADEKFETVENSVPAPWFKKIILIKKEVQEVKLTVCGLGLYELYLNGNSITKGLLCPYISNTDDVVFYDDYYITDKIKQGENEVKFLLGNGFQNAWSGCVWDLEKAAFRSSPKLAFAFEITYTDGELEIIEADESVLTQPSNIMSNDIRIGEVYDAIYKCDKWQNSMLTSAPNGEKRISKISPITVRKEIAPIKLWKEDNSYIYDFGENTAGVCRLNINGYENQKINLVFGEMLKNGKFFIDNITFEKVKDKYYQRDTYICKNGENTWQPTFTYHGFRYVKVEGIDEHQATKELLTYVVFNTDLGEKGGFVCDDEKINTLHKMSLNSTMSNFHHFPTDCPQREKNGWTADAALSSSHTLLFFEPTDNYIQWLINICKAQRKDGALPGIVPTAGWGFEWGNGPAWDCVITELPYQIWQKRNNISAFVICAKNILKYIKYLETKFDEKGLLEIGLGDWCAPQKHIKAPLILTDSIMAYDISKKASMMFEEIGDNEGAKYCKNFAENIRNNIRKHLFNEKTYVFKGECQTSQAMGIYYEIIKPDEKENAFSALMSFVEKEEYHIDVGVLGGRVLFHTLAENGEIDTAIKILKNPTYPTYMQWIDSGDTTLCEGFFDNTQDDSHNHHFWGNISAFFLEQICGIRVSSDKIVVEPNLPTTMNYASGTFNSVFGKISVILTRNNNAVDTQINYDEDVPITTKLQKNYVVKH